MLGLIALDIDGTVAPFSGVIPERVIHYLGQLVAEGWKIVFITGRPFLGGYRTLQHLTFPYYVAVQNGAIIVEMPSKRLVAKRYLDKSVMVGMEQICHSHGSDFIVYGGFEHQDVIYYRPQRLPAPLLHYLRDRILAYGETWQPLSSYEEFHLETFPSVKCFAPYLEAVALANQIENELGLHVPVIRDPFGDQYYVIQGTHPQINKGQALLDTATLLDVKGPLIAAGDDLNDVSMLSVADIKVVMNTAPASVLKIADIVAASAEEEGIIQGLGLAIKKVT